MVLYLKSVIEVVLGVGQHTVVSQKKANVLPLEVLIPMPLRMHKPDVYFLKKMLYLPSKSCQDGALLVFAIPQQ